MASTVSIFWILPARFRHYGLIGITIAFLLIYAPASAAILALFAFVTYFGTRRAEPSGLETLAASAIVVAVLVYYKLRANAWHGDNMLTNAVIPLGLSYYSFRCIHYVIERYRVTLQVPSIREFVGYLFFLPTMLVGPINRAAPYFDDQRTHRWRFDDLLFGLERMLYGYAKITILSGLLVNRWIRGYASTLPQDSGAQTYVLVIANTLDLYFLFAGYSDIAIGFARLLGYRILENFNWPYLQKNISDFWRAWHISLSSWCRDYIYLPVVGATRNPYLGTLATFTVIGLWHELSIRYILWGLWHGAGILGWRKLQELKYRWRLPRARSRFAVYTLNVISVILTFHYVALGLVIVAGKSLSDASATYRNLLVGW